MCLLGDLDLCRTSELECEDECRLNALGEAHCACLDGRRLNPDNRTCSGGNARNKNSPSETVAVDYLSAVIQASKFSSDIQQ